MKKYFNYFLLAVLTALSISIVSLRVRGSIPSQIPAWLTILILVLNSGWIFWNLRETLLGAKQTRMEKN